jgi:hypothetical protein
MAPHRPLPMAPEEVTLGQLYLLIMDQRHEIASQRQEIQDLTGEVAMARKETAEMVDLWKSGRTIVAIFKTAGAIAAAGLAVWGLIALVKGIPTTGTTAG